MGICPSFFVHMFESDNVASLRRHRWIRTLQLSVRSHRPRSLEKHKSSRRNAGNQSAAPLLFLLRDPRNLARTVGHAAGCSSPSGRAGPDPDRNTTSSCRNAGFNQAALQLLFSFPESTLPGARRWPHRRIRTLLLSVRTAPAPDRGPILPVS